MLLREGASIIVSDQMRLQLWRKKSKYSTRYSTKFFNVSNKLVSTEHSTLLSIYPLQNASLTWYSLNSAQDLCLLWPLYYCLVCDDNIVRCVDNMTTPGSQQIDSRQMREHWPIRSQEWQPLTNQKQAQSISLIRCERRKRTSVTTFVDCFYTWGPKNNLSMSANQRNRLSPCDQ